MRRAWGLAFGLVLTLALAACNNNPWPAGSAGDNTLFTSFTERSPRYLDPVASYTAPEGVFAYQIYEPLYGYHYLKRPYQLIPRAASAVVEPKLFDAQGRELPDTAPDSAVAEVVYDIPIRPGMRYAPHPALARDAQGQPRFLGLTRAEIAAKRTPFDFAESGTREVTAHDFEYAFKRHATTRIEAPILSVWAEHIVGLRAYADRIKQEDATLLHGLPRSSRDKPFLDFRRWPLPGVQAVNDHLLRIKLKGRYPQFSYWLATTFAAPVPWEVDAFYAQPGMQDAGFSWNRWPVGAGPFQMAVYEQDRRHVLTRNPHYRGEPYPCEGAPGDAEAGLLADCGKPTPFVDRIEFMAIKERLPTKELFKQGYLDTPDLDRAEWGIEFLADRQDEGATDRLYRERGYRFPAGTDISNWFIGFNMLDPVVGQGSTPEQAAKNRKLRQALSIAIDWEEGYGRIFNNKGGVAAHGPVPPGVFGAREGQSGWHNPVTHRVVNGQLQRRPIEDAKALMVEAGYPDGRDAVTGKPLVINYDFNKIVTPEAKAENDWLAKQFAKLGVQLEVRATDYNQFQEKLVKGKHQMFFWGWFGDYPDAENFLFLLYGPNAKSVHQGENTVNYQNAAYDERFQRLIRLPDGPEKQRLMDEMLTILRTDAPWSFGYFPYVGYAYQSWVHNGKPSIMIRDMARYYRLDPAERVAKLAQWNAPVLWPLALIALGLLAAVLWAWRSARATAQRTGRRAVVS